MTKRKAIDPDTPPTRRSDWFGARIVEPREARAPSKRKGVVFHIYQASTDPGLFAITDRSAPSVLPPCPASGKWRPFKTVAESGEQRIGFSEAEAKADIARHGYHLASVHALAGVT